ncbi:MAG: UDP-glucose/GDP-mannose dehydrogenase family protein [candidate division WOR-3 bacterium]|nr:MAG: UDP-glucose/GDP-mannose dehydrogenase family protein [candidate division WOR-3 bacterium]
MKVCMVGTGYIGLVSGACFAEIGHEVVCVDNDTQKINMLNKGEIPIFEPGLGEMVKKNVRAGRLSFTTDIRKGIEQSLFIFIAVGTPPKASGEADLSGIEHVATEIGTAMVEYRIIVEKSTVPVLTGRRLRTMIEKSCTRDIEFDVASNPEFLREGAAVNEFLCPDRIVLGVESKKAEQRLLELYKPINAPKIVTDIASAELIKLTSNAFLSTKISFINAVSVLCEKTGADIVKVAEGMGMDKRIGRAFLNAGVGYGGSCFPKDLKAFISMSSELGYDFRLLKEVERINEDQMLRVVKKAEESLQYLRGRTIGILGLAFKPNTDDMRDAPSITVIKALQKAGAVVKAYDPAAIERAKKMMKGIDYCRDLYETADGVDAIILVTEWDEFKQMDLERVRRTMRKPVFIDGRNVFEPKKMKDLGFIYCGIGR